MAEKKSLSAAVYVMIGGAVVFCAGILLLTIFFLWNEKITQTTAIFVAIASGLVLFAGICGGIASWLIGKRR